jgi:hypothetical protein
MSRYFMIQSWVGSHENEPDYNGQQCGERNIRSIEAVPLYDQFGNANVSAFSDEAIAARNGVKKASAISIQDKILPQKKRLNTLRSQMIDLEREYKTTNMSISEYSVLRDVLVAKVQRAEVLYRKAIAQKPIQMPEDEAISYVNSFSNHSDNDGHGESYSSPVGVSFFAEVIDELSNDNSLKSFLKMSCRVIRGLVRFSSATKRYIKTLSEV